MATTEQSELCLWLLETKIILLPRSIHMHPFGNLVNSLMVFKKEITEVLYDSGSQNTKKRHKLRLKYPCWERWTNHKAIPFLSMDALGVVVDAEPEHIVSGALLALLYFSGKLRTPYIRYNTSGRELAVTNLAAWKNPDLAQMTGTERNHARNLWVSEWIVHAPITESQDNLWLKSQGRRNYSFAWWLIDFPLSPFVIICASKVTKYEMTCSAHVAAYIDLREVAVMWSNWMQHVQLYAMCSFCWSRIIV